MKLAAAGLAALCCVPHVMQAQTRAELIESAKQAYDSLDVSRATLLLRSAVHPQAGPPDSLWASGVQLLVQTLLDQQADTLAVKWAAWAMSVSPRMPLDTLTYLPQVIAILNDARQQAVQADAPAPPQPEPPPPIRAASAPVSQASPRVVSKGRWWPQLLLALPVVGGAAAITVANLGGDAGDGETGGISVQVPVNP